MGLFNKLILNVPSFNKKKLLLIAISPNWI